MKKYRKRLSGSNRITLIILIISLCIIMTLNAVLVQAYESVSIKSEGQVRLSNITGRVDNSLYRSECLLNSVAMQIEHIIAMDDDTAAQLDAYFSSEIVEEIRIESNGNCFGVYAAHNGNLYMNDFVPDEDFVLDERAWYIGAKKRMGAIHITEPYIDANTGELCYSMSKVLSDGTTVVGLDFSFGEIQSYIEEMNENGSGISFIVNDAGMIMGHSEAGYVGQNSGELDFYNELVNKVYMLYGESFDYRSGNVRYSVFSDKTNYDWYLIVCVDEAGIYGLGNSISLYILLFMFVFAVGIVLFFIRICHNKAAAEKALAVKEAFLEDLSRELRSPLARITQRADNIDAFGEGGNYAAAEIGDAAKEISRMVDNIVVKADTEVQKSVEEDIVKGKDSSENHRSKIALITLVLVITGLISCIFNTIISVGQQDTEMEKETISYLNQVEEWALTNKTVLDVIADSIAVQDGFGQDYEFARDYLDDIVSKYDGISVAYLCNPEWEHTVIMNNGWEPDEDWHVEERQWYVDTMASTDNFNISAPYLDEQTGLYCATLSKIVYDDKGNFIGVLGIDYYLDKLIAILGESYTDTGYAFLTDGAGNIINHPYEEYQMTAGSTVNATELSYRMVLPRIDADSSFVNAVSFRDYDGKLKVCIGMREDVSGFNVLFVQNIWEMIGDVVYSVLFYCAMFAVCIISVNVIMLNVTRWQIKVNRELQEAAEQAINAGKAKNDFLANMSHEIRTPINAVLGMNEMIMRESGEENVVGYASNIQSAGRTLLSIINDILDFSKIESGKMEIVPVEYDVSSLVNDIVNMVKRRAEKKKLQFIPEIDETIPAVLYGDDVRLRQIITNILTNAVKYTHKGSVRLKMNVLEKTDKVVKLKVQVTDTGIGIKEEDLEKLFTSFQRLDQEKNRNIEGTGLGITIVQRLLHMMDSRLEVTSKYGEGSTFSFVIEQRIIKDEPIGDYGKRFHIATEIQDNENIKTAPRARVLVVDDNETNILVAKSLLKRTRVNLDTASSGKQCIQMLKKNSYDVVFLDHMMPEMDGIETLKVIKEEKLGENTVFISLTANAIHGARQSYLDAGFDDYLSKPFTGHDIEKCLFSYLDDALVERSEVQTETIGDETTDVSVEPVQVKASEDKELFNVETGMVYTGGDLDTYHEVLETYVNRAEEKQELMANLYEEKSWKNYIIEVHALKSSSLIIGSNKLSELAKELEFAGKEERYEVIDEKNQMMLDMYKQVVAIGRDYLYGLKAPQSETDMADLMEISAEEVAQMAMKIEMLCSICDADEVIEICEEAAGYSVNGIALKPLFDEVRAAVSKLEYELASMKAKTIYNMVREL